MTDGALDDLARLTPDLASLGWDDELDRWADDAARQLDLDPETVIRGRLARVSRGHSVVFVGGEAVLAASASTRSDTGVEPATGDFVLVADDEDDGPHIAATAPRRTTLQRRAAGRVPEPQVLAANMDGVLVMHGLDRELNLRRIERQLVVAWDSGAIPTVVLTKADVADDLAASVEAVVAIAPGADVIATSTVTGVGLDHVAALTRGHTVAMFGLSGIGKSSLVNVLSDGVVQRIGEVRATDHRGRHTTVTRDLIPLPGGGLVIDAPGVREIGLWQAYDGMARAFPVIAGAVTACRFADCEHRQEPGCAVRAAVDAGEVAERRLDHWRELQAELDLQESQLAEFARRSESRQRAGAEEEADRTRSDHTRRSRRGGRRRR
ncbi:MAG: ribosome small subunit-dependent GTPase A [Acidimicrobiales bacterium]